MQIYTFIFFSLNTWIFTSETMAVKKHSWEKLFKILFYIFISNGKFQSQIFHLWKSRIKFSTIFHNYFHKCFSTAIVWVEIRWFRQKIEIIVEYCDYYIRIRDFLLNSLGTQNSNLWFSTKYFGTPGFYFKIFHPDKKNSIIIYSMSILNCGCLYDFINFWWKKISYKRALKPYQRSRFSIDRSP